MAPFALVALGAFFVCVEVDSLLCYDAHKAMEEMSAVHAAMNNLAIEALSLVRTSSSTAMSGAYSLAIALGRLCAQLELDPKHLKECIDLAHREEATRKKEVAQKKEAVGS